MRLGSATIILVGLWMGCPAASAQQATPAGGREATAEYERRPTTKIEWEERRELVYRQRYRTEMAEAQRQVLVPVTEYTWQPRVHNWWNPLVPNHIAYHLVPRTRWEARSETVRYPTTKRELVPEEHIVRTPKRTLGFVAQQREVRSPASSLAERPTRLAELPDAPTRLSGEIGGVQRLQNDPPRYHSGARLR